MARSRKEISKKILNRLLISGAIIIAAQSPYFWLNFYKNIFSGRPIFKKKIRDTFYNLKKRGLITIEKKNRNLYMFLTEEGKKEAGKYQINDLEIKRPKKWDKKWRLIIFDIPENFKIKRDLFRGKIKELGFYQLQKSVWAYPYPCEKEINILKGFLGFRDKNLIILTVEKIENSENLRKFFNLYPREA